MCSTEAPPDSPSPFEQVRDRYGERLSERRDEKERQLRDGSSEFAGGMARLLLDAPRACPYDHRARPAPVLLRAAIDRLGPDPTSGSPQTEGRRDSSAGGRTSGPGRGTPATVLEHTLTADSAPSRVRCAGVTNPSGTRESFRGGSSRRRRCFLHFPVGYSEHVTVRAQSQGGRLDLVSVPDRSAQGVPGRGRQLVLALSSGRGPHPQQLLPDGRGKLIDRVIHVRRLLRLRRGEDRLGHLGVPKAIPRHASVHVAPVRLPSLCLSTRPPREP